MEDAQGIAGELSLGEVISKTFELFRRDFWKYLILYLVVGAVIGVFTTLVQRSIVLPTPPPLATPEEALAWLPGFFGALFALIFLTLVISWLFYPISAGSAVKLASDEIEKGQAELGTSVRFAVSKLISVWAVSLLAGIVICLGLIALVVPGIILAIMFSLALPAVLIGRTGIVESLGRSRTLISDRWLKTLALLVIFGIIFAAASIFVNAISGPFGPASTIVSSVLSAFYIPLIPIALTVYYYSNAARIAPPTPAAPPAGQPQLGTKFCPSCGTQLAFTATFCSNCGAKQPA